MTELADDAEWILRDVGNDRAYVIRRTGPSSFAVFDVTIDAISIAASAALGVGAVLGGGAGSGAGALAVNIILSRTNAYIAATDDVTSEGDVAISATSTSAIVATIISASVAVGVGGMGGAALSIGVALASNLIGIEDGGTTNTNSAGAVTLNPGDTVLIDSGPDKGKVFEYIGTAQLAGVDLRTETYTSARWREVKSHEVSDGAVTLDEGDTVTVDTGPNTGKVFKYVGTTQLADVNLLTETYTDTRRWREVTSRRPVQVQAYVLNSTVVAVGVLSAMATARQTIASIVVAGSASVAVGGVAGVGASGAGASARNLIATQVVAYVEGGGPLGVKANAITLTARDTSTIKADVGAGSLAAGIGLVVGVAVSIAVSLAEKSDRATPAPAYARNTTLLARADAIAIGAYEGATITSLTVAASLSVGAGGGSRASR